MVLNILHGRIEYIQGKPIGTLVVSLDGKREVVQEAIEYMKHHIEEIEIIKETEGDIA